MKEKTKFTHKQMTAMVRSWCNKHRFSPQEASLELGLSRQYLSRCFKGERKYPDEVLEVIGRYECASETVWTYHKKDKEVENAED